MEWIKVKLKSFLKQYRIEHRVQDDVVYKQVTISKHTGVSYRGQKLGKEIGRKRQFLIDLDLYPNTLMFVRQGVQDGSIGFAPFEVNKCIVTENMPMFSVENIDINFIKEYLNSSLFRDILSGLATKGAAQKSIHEKELLEVEVLIPKTIEEQKDFANILRNTTNSSVKISSEIIHQLDLINDLRQAFLREAMQGILVSNETQHGATGADLLAEIQAEKAQLVKEKKIKKPKPLAPITEDELPFDIPENWTWCRLGEVSANIHYGFNASSNSNLNDVKLLRITDIQNNKVNWDSVPGCIYTNNDIVNYSLNNNDILIARTGGTIGKSYIVKNIQCLSLFASYLIRVIPSKNINADFLKYFIESPNYWKQLMNAAWGAGILNVNGTALSNLKLSLPPLEIQERIVAKLDELMAVCDALETQVKQSQHTNEQLLQQVLREALGA